MGVTYVEAKLVGKRRFSNKAFSIDVELYEQQMAKVIVNRKKRFRSKKCYRSYFCFDNCLSESVSDYLETLKGLHKDKVARRWLRKVMLHCMEGLINPNGGVDCHKVDEKDEIINYKNQTNMILGVKHLQIIKRYIPELFFAGNYRMDYMPNYREKYIMSEKNDWLPSKMMSNETWRIRYERRKNNAKGMNFYASAIVFLDLIKELSESFYQKIEKERTLDDCSVRMEYIWLHGEKPELRIRVQDNTYTSYYMPI